MEQGKKMKKRIIIMVVCLICLASMLRIVRSISWTPKENQLADLQENFQAEQKSQQVQASNIEEVENEPENLVSSDEQSTKDSSEVLQDENKHEEVAPEASEIEKQQVDEKGDTKTTEITQVSNSSSTDEVIENTTMKDNVVIDETKEKEVEGKEEGSIIHSGIDNSAGSQGQEDKMDVQEPVKEENQPQEEQQQEKEQSQVQVKDAWVQDKIDENIDSINQDDLIVGSEIYNKLDTKYLMSIAEGGITEDEQLELIAYLKDNLTDEEIDIAMQLYSKYIHLLNNE